jgi:hypothetical protein
MLASSNHKLNEEDCRSIYNEFILQAEYCGIPQIADMKRDFNLNWSKAEVSEINDRLASYTPLIAAYLTPENTATIEDKLNVLKGV